MLPFALNEILIFAAFLLNRDSAVQLRRNGGGLKVVLPKDIRQPSTFMNFDVVVVLAQYMDQLPDLANVLFRARFESENRSARIKTLRRSGQVGVKPDGNSPQVFPFVACQIAKTKESIGGRKEAL